MATVELCATVRETVRFEGVGLHTGELCRIAIHPVSEVRTPCAITLRKGASVFPARWDFVVDTTRATVLGDGATRIGTVEHLMAALWITGITHCDIEVLQGDEIPILDGSALPFVEALGAVKIVMEKLPPSLRFPPLREGNQPNAVPPAGRGNLKEGVMIEARHADRYLGLSFGGSVLFGYIDFPAPLGVQAGAFPLAAAAEQIAPARTFGFLREVEALRQQGLAQGGALDNALVIDETGYHNPARFEDEPLRHKLLDVLGDLYLCGARLTGFTLVAIKPGHALNVQLARQVAQTIFAED
ncbi:MAG: UDP-3-O-acyl-N-acetylglucosamine deacetylase [Armatimonadota bacterium]|nr:UDP-3-O-acyl-N-acetylglucosamine deacetylase [Armatimonadota bacterium]